MVNAGEARLFPPLPVAVPVIGTLTEGCFGSLLVIVSTALNLPLTVGEKVTLMRLAPPGENVNGPVPTAENGEPAGPLTLPASVPVPWLITLTVALA